MATLVGKPITSNGLGLMRLTRPQDPVSDEIAFPVLKAALACGANVWNGADFYGTEEANSLHLLNRYFTKYPEDAEKVDLGPVSLIVQIPKDVPTNILHSWWLEADAEAFYVQVISIKSGVVNMTSFDLDCSAKAMRQKVDKCNKILDGKKFIDIFGPARVDPNVPIETTVAALHDLVKEGKIGGIQLSEVRAETIKRAVNVAKIAMVEAEISLWATDVFSNGVAETCGELGITVVAHTPLGAGVLTGEIQKRDDLAPNDYHRFFPRFQSEFFEKNLELVHEVKKLAEIKSCTTSQLALSWIKSFNGRPGMPFILHVAGARSADRVRENCMTIDLDENDLAKISDILASFPVMGARYPGAAAKIAEY